MTLTVYHHIALQVADSLGDLDLAGAGSKVVALSVRLRLRRELSRTFTPKACRSVTPGPLPVHYRQVTPSLPAYHSVLSSSPVS